MARLAIAMGAGCAILSRYAAKIGNVTACLLGRSLGLPVARVLAATNRNDTVPRYLADGRWAPPLPSGGNTFLPGPDAPGDFTYMPSASPRKSNRPAAKSMRGRPATTPSFTS